MRTIKKILVVDDDKNICELLNLYLKKEGFEVVFAYDGSEAVTKAKNENPNLIVLDVMMPVINGWEACKLIRQFTQVPIIMLTALDTTENKVQGLNIGADDYIVKPFEPVEVIARINAHLRREENKETTENVQNSSEITVDNISINLEKYEVKLDGNIVEDLKPKEIQLLYFFLTNKNQVFTREQLLDKVWGYEYFGGTRTVDVHIKSVREKLSSSNNKWEIKTIWNVGYKFETKEN
ncbi:MAG: response regulator transcription factor [Clostridia bacterium]|nr:response regulator transcription factor [Clostridia bacterium]